MLWHSARASRITLLLFGHESLISLEDSTWRRPAAAADALLHLCLVTLVRGGLCVMKPELGYRAGTTRKTKSSPPRGQGTGQGVHVTCHMSGRGDGS